MWAIIFFSELGQIINATGPTCLYLPVPDPLAAHKPLISPLTNPHPTTPPSHNSSPTPHPNTPHSVPSYPASHPPPFIFPSPEDTSPQAHRRSASGYAPSTSTPAGYGIQFPSTPGRPPTPLSSPRSPFPDWAASIFRSSTGGGGGLDAEGFSAERGDGERPPASPRFDGTPARTRQLRRAASTSWW